MIKKPYLLFLGDAHDQLAVKVAKGIRDWRPEDALGQLRLPGCQADLELPDMTIEEALKAGAQTMIIGVANRGGTISDSWKELMIKALENGLDLASGLHNMMRDDPLLVAAAKKNGRKLVDVRRPKENYPIADGQKRSGKRCLCVGTDCSVGKMYTGMAMDAEMKKRNMKVSFRATGQTGILITGEGIPLDAIPADFMAGAVEWVSPDNDPDHWDLIEGQGSLFHVSFSGVTLALIHGGQPDALVICHEPTRKHMRGLPNFELPTLEAVRDLSLETAKLANPNCKVVGVSINTEGLNDQERQSYLADVEDRMGLPAVDPYLHGAKRLIDELEKI